MNNMQWQNNGMNNYNGMNNGMNNGMYGMNGGNMMGPAGWQQPAGMQTMVMQNEPMQTTQVGGVLLHSPSTFEHVQLILDHLKNREQVIVDFKSLNKQSVYRILDFISGAVYALDATMQNITENIILIAPSGVNISMPQELTKKK